MPLVKSNPTGPPQPGPVVCEDLEGDLGSPEPRKRREAARLLAGFPESVAVLGERLPIETDTAVRETILTSLGRIGG
ncbi:HEAT repeat domain-containing protein, partial [Rhodoplanes sp. SY1]|uniref:HEAT repeat domain-containing protein n=1 Tax=Rhodoplanes sp. SY1 TaxID=3166646 RepID=UPI0038B5DEE8